MWELGYSEESQRYEINAKPGSRIVITVETIDKLSGACCSATNDNDDAECSICCDNCEEARCTDATGSSTPTCECES